MNARGADLHERHAAAASVHGAITTRTRETDQRGEPVADMRFRILKFRPRTEA